MTARVAQPKNHQKEFQQAVDRDSRHALMKFGPDWAGTARVVENRARQKAQKQVCTVCPPSRGRWGQQWESSLGKKGLRDRNSPMCTLSQNGYGGRRSELAAAKTFCPFPVKSGMCHVDGTDQKSAGENFSREWPLALGMLSLSVGSIGGPRGGGRKSSSAKNPETTAHHLPLGQRRRRAVGVEPG